MSNRIPDGNGWFEVKGNPISKVGVFPYSGEQLGLTKDHPKYKSVMMVYRPEEELADPACIESFKLIPWIDEHVMLGSEDNGRTPAEEKGVGGVIGEQVYFEYPYLKANIKCFSEAQASAVANGKEQLSSGYGCVYDLTSGTFEGQHYDAVQRKIRGNHLASVDEGRMGPDVAVLDHMVFTVDSKEFSLMADENTENTSADLGQLPALLEQLAPIMAALQKVAGAAPTAPVEPEPVIDEEEQVKEPEPTVDEDTKEKAPEAMDAMLKEIKQLRAEMAAFKKQQPVAMDSALIVAEIANRDGLAQRLSGFVGTFDHAKLDTKGVAKYGVEKLGIPCQAGQEVTVLNAWLHGREPNHTRTLSTGMDGKKSEGVNLLSQYDAE